MERWLCPLSLGFRRCRCPSVLQNMLILLFSVLLTWPNLRWSFSAESFALVHGLEWCHYHLKTYHILSFLVHQRFSNGPSVSPTIVLLDYLGPLRLSLLPFSSKLPVGFGYAGLPDNELAGSLTETGAPLPFSYVPIPLAPVKQRQGKPLF